MSQLAANLENQVSPPSQDSGGLLALAQQKRHYELLAAGYPLVESHAADAGLIMLMIRSLVALGLGGPARELLQHARQRKLDIDFDAVRAMLVPLPIGRVPWSELADQFEANCAALRAAQPELHDALEAVTRAAQSSQLFRAADGTPLVSMPRSNAVRQWNPALVDPAVFARVQIAEVKGGQSMLVVGLGAHGLLQRIASETDTSGSSGSNSGGAGVLLLVAEQDADRTFAALHTFNFAPLLTSGRVRLFIGEHAPDQLAAFLEKHADVDPPSASVSMQWSAPLAQSLSHIVHQERARREEEFKSIVATLRTRAERRTPGAHADRIRPGATILGFTSRFTTMLQYSMRDIGAALAEHGYNFILERELDEQRTHTSLTIARAIERHDPALVIMINHFRCERALAMIGVPVLSWIQDPTPTVLSRETGESFTELDFACGYYVTECTQQFGYPANQFFSQCLPVSSHLFHDAALSASDEKRVACDVMYVGHRHADADQHKHSWRESLPATLHPLLDRLSDCADRLIASGEPISDAPLAVRQCADESRLALSQADINRLATYYFARLHDILYRAQTLRWVAQWARKTGHSFKLYGKGWSQDAHLAAHAVGPIEHGEPLRQAYRGAKIVLQTLPAGFMHQRTFEGLASGSLVLSRHAPTSSAAEYFPDVSRVIFTGESQLLSMLDRFLADESLRMSVTNELRSVVLSRLTYSAVVPELIDNIQQCLRSA